MTELREATESDFPEIIQMMISLWVETGQRVPDGVWKENVVKVWNESQADGTMRVVVVTEDDVIASCGVGVITQVSPSYWNESGKVGYLQFFFTKPEFRGRKLGKQILDELMCWYSLHKIQRVKLNASQKAIPFYEAVGFEMETDYPAMTWLPPDATTQ